jgi:capsular polysaccharide biosynthesis protein
MLGSIAVNSMTAQYRSTSQVFVSLQSSDLSPETMLQGLSFTQQQVSSYADIVTSPLVLEPVIENLGLEEEPEELADRVEASSRTDTVLIDITVTDARPATAQRIADEIAVSLGDVIVRLERPVGNDQTPVQVTTVRPALLPEDPSGPNRLFMIAIGGALGLSAGVGLSLLAQSRRREGTNQAS